LQRGVLILGRGHDQLAAALVRDTTFLTIPIQLLPPAHAQACLAAARRVIQAGVDHFGISAAGVRTRDGFALEHDCFQAGARHPSGDGQSDHAGANDDAVHAFHRLACT
jgi:hypothetical protein